MAYVITREAAKISRHIQEAIDSAKQGFAQIPEAARTYSWSVALARYNPLRAEAVIYWGTRTRARLQEIPLEVVRTEVQQSLNRKARRCPSTSTCPYRNIQNMFEVEVLGRLVATLGGDTFLGL